MWFIIYFKEHFARIIKGTIVSLSGKAPMSAFMLLIPGIIGYFIDSEYLSKVYMSLICGFGGLGLFCFSVFLFYLFKTPIDIYKEDRESIKNLTELQKPKLQIYFNENENGFIEDEYADYGKNIGRQINNRTIRIRIDNLSKSNAVEGVEVLLTDIDKSESQDKGKLPVRLELKNKTSSYPDSFIIPIDGKVFFNVISAYFVVDKRKMCVFNICHIEQRNNYTDIPIQRNAEETEYKIKIEVKSSTTVCDPKYFMIGLRDNLIKMLEV